MTFSYQLIKTVAKLEKETNIAYTFHTFIIVSTNCEISTSSNLVDWRFILCDCWNPIKRMKPHRAITVVSQLVIPLVPLSDSFVSPPCLVPKGPLADQCLSTYRIGLQKTRDAISRIAGKFKKIAHRKRVIMSHFCPVHLSALTPQTESMSLTYL